MVEVAENLHRREITALERAELQAKWIETRGRKDTHKPAKVRPVSEKGGRGKIGGINKAAAELGIPRSTLQQSVRISSLSDDAKEAAKASGLDNNQSALLEAAKHKEPIRQVEVIKKRQRGSE